VPDFDFNRSRQKSSFLLLFRLVIVLAIGEFLFQPGSGKQKYEE
jgi:hypothetical protein